MVNAVNTRFTVGGESPAPGSMSLINVINVDSWDVRKCLNSYSQNVRNVEYAAGKTTPGINLEHRGN